MSGDGIEHFINRRFDDEQVKIFLCDDDYTEYYLGLPEREMVKSKEDEGE